MVIRGAREPGNPDSLFFNTWSWQCYSAFGKQNQWHFPLEEVSQRERAPLAHNVDLPHRTLHIGECN
ncbi:unnamed protein product [Caretta caretta]